MKVRKINYEKEKKIFSRKCGDDELEMREEKSLRCEDEV